MDRKAFSGIMLTLLLIIMLTLAFNIQPVRASGIIYIRADGSVDPPTAPISTVDNVTYNFIGNINESIVVERDNIVVDGAGYTLQGTGAYDSRGINLTGRTNVTIKNTNIKNFYYGIWLSSSLNNSISGNNITNNEYGIWVEYSSNVSIYGNNASVNEDHGIRLRYTNDCRVIDNIVNDNYDGYGIWLSHSNEDMVKNNTANRNHNYNIIVEYANNTTVAENKANECVNSYGNIAVEGDYCSVLNNIAKHNYVGFDIEGEKLVFCGNLMENNTVGLRDHSSKSFFYHNNFINNTNHVYSTGSKNTWDNGYPSGGNYWSDYPDVDLLGGPYQNETGSDGIGDTAHVIDANNIDNYPLMGMFYDFTVEIEGRQFYHVHVISNSIVSKLYVMWWLTSPNEYLQAGDKFIRFDVAGEEGNVGFCRIMIPRVVLNVSYIVLADWHEVPVTELPISNSTHAYLYFTYTQPNELMIVPEFPTWTSMLLILILLSIAIAIYKRRLLKTPIH